ARPAPRFRARTASRRVYARSLRRSGHRQSTLPQERLPPPRIVETPLRAIVAAVDLRNAVCLVTGASSGIGRETAIALAERGAVVAVCARRKDKLDDTLAASRTHSPRSIAVQCDVSDAQQVQEMVDELTMTLGGVDVLVANAGWGRYAPFDDETIETIDSQVRTNVLGQMYCTLAVLPHMKEQRRGQLVFLSSTNGRIPPALQAVYNATKAAAWAFGETLSHEVKAFGIGVTIVYPGPIETEFFDA